MLKFSLGGSSSGFTQVQRILASDRATGDRFGYSIALSSGGDTSIIGAPIESTSPTTTNGAVYVLVRSGTTWTEQQKLLASDKASADNFGISVALSGDGNTAIVGADAEDTSPNTNNGAAYVFTRSGSTWTEQQKLLASDASSNDRFGISVALSGDGNTAIVGAYDESTSPYTKNGAAYVFTRSGSTWTEQQKLTASDISSDDKFGISVYLSSDGNTAIIGAPDASASPVSFSGAAYVFTRSGSVWTEQQKLIATDRSANDRFGISVALSDDGNTAIVGADVESTSPRSGNGAAYVFTRSGSTWTEQQKLLVNDPLDNNRFGASVSISGDGITSVIGAPLLGGVGQVGSAYVFTKSGSGWVQEQKLTPTPSTFAERFGIAVSISANSNVAMVGADEESIFPSTNHGAAYVFVA